MLLSNYWTWYRRVSNNISASTVSACTDTTGATATWYQGINNSFQYGVYNRLLANWLSLALGTGTTAPTASDYVLESDLTSSFSNTSQSMNVTYGTAGFEITLNITGSNNSGSDITINEIGILKAYSSVGNATVTGYVLFAREVLDTPITVADGQTFSITYTWKQQ